MTDLPALAQHLRALWHGDTPEPLGPLDASADPEAWLRAARWCQGMVEGERIRTEADVDAALDAYSGSDMLNLESVVSLIASVGRATRAGPAPALDALLRDAERRGAERMREQAKDAIVETASAGQHSGSWDEGVDCHLAAAILHAKVYQLPLPGDDDA